MGLHTGRYVLTKNLIKKITGTGGGSPTPSGDTNSEFIEIDITEDFDTIDSGITTDKKLDLTKDLHFINFYRVYSGTKSTVFSCCLMGKNNFNITRCMYIQNPSIDWGNSDYYSVYNNVDGYLVLKRFNVFTESKYHNVLVSFSESDIEVGSTKTFTIPSNIKSNLEIKVGNYSVLECIMPFSRFFDTTSITNSLKSFEFKGHTYSCNIYQSGYSDGTVEITQIQ